jgi:tRNA threonylcarbamoyladenosine biosynthesis protein TsaE
VISHLDLYRIGAANEVWELGWRDLGQENEVVLIEWPERAESLLPVPRWDVRLQAHGSDPLRRLVFLKPVREPPDVPPPQHD